MTTATAPSSTTVIGEFDSFHRGHRNLVAAARLIAEVAAARLIAERHRTMDVTRRLVTIPLG